jgi:hypothetical protein
MIVFEKGSQEAVSWLWKDTVPGEFTTFSISGDSCMKIINGGGEEVALLRLGYAQNRLIFDGDNDSRIYVVAVIKDFSNLPSGIYTYEILVKSLIDSLKIEDSGELEIINA